MKEYIRPNEAFMMLDKTKMREWAQKYDRKKPLKWVRNEFDRMIWEGRIFYVVSGSGILLQKDSVIEAYPDLLKDEYLSSKKKKRPNRSFPEPHVCSLHVEGFENMYQGNIRIDDIFCDYRLDIPYLKESLEHEGVFPILNCTCGIVCCDGRYVEVRHISEETITWVMLYCQEDYPIKSLNGHLMKEDDYREYVKINKRLDKIKEPRRKEVHFKARDIIQSGRRIMIPLPLFFSRTQLEKIAG